MCKTSSLVAKVTLEFPCVLFSTHSVCSDVFKPEKCYRFNLMKHILEHKICISISKTSYHPICTEGWGAQAHPFIPSTEEKHNAMHNSFNSYKAGSSVQTSWAISYLCQGPQSVSIHRPCIISSDTVSELHLNEKQYSPTGSWIEC